MELVLVASILIRLLLAEYSARWMATVSVAGGGGGACAVTLRVAVLVTPPYAAEIVTGVDADTVRVVTVKLAPVAPAATVMLAGTDATPVLLLDSVTTAPPVGAAAVSVMLPCAELPPVTVDGVSVKVERAGGSGGGGTLLRILNTRTEDHARSCRLRCDRARATSSSARS